MQRYKTIPKRVQALLAKDEGLDCDFKKDKSFSSEDLVAFANSSHGGAILLGVDEVTDCNGSQAGKPFGCQLNDGLRLAIFNKAGDCTPPIDVKISEVNRNAKPFVVIDIPSGEHKPYCTKKGVYKIRGDGKNQPMTPTIMLRILMEREAEAFIDRFRTATKNIEQNLTDFHQSIKSEMSDMSFDLRQSSEDLDKGLRQIQYTSYEAEANTQEANAVSQDSAAMTAEIFDEVKSLVPRLNEALDKLDSILIGGRYKDRTLEPSRLLGIVREQILREDYELNDGAREIYFKCYPTAQEADWKRVVEFYSSLRDQIVRAEKEGAKRYPKKKRPNRKNSV